MGKCHCLDITTDVTQIECIITIIIKTFVNTFPAAGLFGTILWRHGKITMYYNVCPHRCWCQSKYNIIAKPIANKLHKAAAEQRDTSGSKRTATMFRTEP